MITLLRAAGADDLTPDDYRDIFDELRATRSLRALVEAAGAPEGRIAYWSRYGRDLAAVPDLQARNELRALVGQPELPADAGQMLASAVDPGAAIYLAKPNGPAAKVLLVGSHAGDLAIDWPAQGEPIIRSQRALARAQARRPRRKTVNLAPPTHARLVAGAHAAGLTIEAFVERLITHFEENAP